MKNGKLLSFANIRATSSGRIGSGPEKYEMGRTFSGRRGRGKRRRSKKLSGYMEFGSGGAIQASSYQLATSQDQHPFSVISAFSHCTGA
jgi:hypothetical protein